MISELRSTVDYQTTVRTKPKPECLNLQSKQVFRKSLVKKTKTSNFTLFNWTGEFFEFTGNIAYRNENFNTFDYWNDDSEENSSKW